MPACGARADVVEDALDKNLVIAKRFLFFIQVI